MKCVNITVSPSSSSKIFLIMLFLQTWISFGKESMFAVTVFLSQLNFCSLGIFFAGISEKILFTVSSLLNFYFKGIDVSIALFLGLEIKS